MENLLWQEKTVMNLFAILSRMDYYEKHVFYHVQQILFPFSPYIRLLAGGGNRFLRCICTKYRNLWLIHIANACYFAIIRNGRYLPFFAVFANSGCENATKIPQIQKNGNSLSLLSCPKVNDMSEYAKRIMFDNSKKCEDRFFIS